MSQNELIADRIEEAIRKMFSTFSQYNPKATEFSMFYNPTEHQSWFIEIYFADSNQLKEALNNGTCYEVYNYLLDELANYKELENVERSIYFEFGNRPSNNKEIKDRHLSLIEKAKRMSSGEGQTDIKICNCCGHDFEQHELKGFNNDESDAPMKGWIMCPRENCSCFLTWGANYTNEK